MRSKLKIPPLWWWSRPWTCFSLMSKCHHSQKHQTTIAVSGSLHRHLLPIGGLYATYHLLREPGNSIDKQPSFQWTKNMPAAADNSTKLIWMSLRPFAGRGAFGFGPDFFSLNSRLNFQKAQRDSYRFQRFETQMFPFLSVLKNQSYEF